MARDIVRKRKAYIALEMESEAVATPNDMEDMADGEETAEPTALPASAQPGPASEIVGSVELGSRRKARGARLMQVTLASVDELLPTKEDLPNSRMGRFLFADRLGVHLMDGVMMLTGTYPGPDRNEITLHTRAAINSREGRVIVRASKSFHNAPAYSFVELQGKDGVNWFGQVILLFTCEVKGAATAVALVNYLTEAAWFKHRCPSKRAFQWTSAYPDCVDLSLVLRPVTMVHVPWAMQPHVAKGKQQPLFVLISSKP